MATKKPICLYAGELKELQPGDDVGAGGGVSIPYQPDAPDNPSDGDLWIDSDENAAVVIPVLKVWDAATEEWKGWLLVRLHYQLLQHLTR